MTIFSKIIKKEIPAEIVYEDPLCLAFKDIHPKAPVHVLMIPKKEIPSHADLTEEDSALVGHMMIQLKKIAENLNLLDSGYRIVLNTKADGGQEAYHLHFHLLGGRQMTWPPG